MVCTYLSSKTVTGKKICQQCESCIVFGYDVYGAPRFGIDFVKVWMIVDVIARDFQICDKLKNNKCYNL